MNIYYTHMWKQYNISRWNYATWHCPNTFCYEWNEDWKYGFNEKCQNFSVYIWKTMQGFLPPVFSSHSCLLSCQGLYTGIALLMAGLKCIQLMRMPVISMMTVSLNQRYTLCCHQTSSILTFLAQPSSINLILKEDFFSHLQYVLFKGHLRIC